jgi:hypothetical protein
MTRTKRVVPAFATEAEEAEWWYKNRNVHGKQLLAAVKSGEAQRLTKEKLLERIAASRKTPAPVVALRIPAADLALARKQAEKKGLLTRPTSNRCSTKRWPHAKSGKRDKYLSIFSEPSLLTF